MTTWRCTNCTYTPLSAGTHHCPRCSWTVFEPIDDGQREDAVSDTDQRAHDQAAADMAHRDDLARDAARLWREIELSGPPVATMRQMHPEFARALDRLAAAYGETP